VVFIGQIKTTDRSFVDQLKTLAAKAGVEAQIRFLGEQPFNALPSLFNAMTIVTALSRNEGYGLTVLEAMSSGKPVVASRAGAWPDIIEHDRNGCLVDVDDIEATRSALERLIQNPNTRERLGNAARQHVLARYTIQAEAEALLSHYRRLAARH
jgi:mannosyltransferase